MAIQEQSIVLVSGFRKTVSQSLPQLKTPVELLAALAIGMTVWYASPSAPLDEKGVHFLATLTVGVALWILEVFDDYVVGLMLLLSWVILKIVPSQLALAGFSHSSWFFVVSALGLGASVHKSGLLHRLAVRALNRIPIRSQGMHSVVLFAAGLLITPLLPTGKARVVIGLPVSEAIAKGKGFPDRSNGSAALTLSALIGFGNMSFLFLTGGEFCLLAWNLLPGAAKSEFGWMRWFSAALPAGVIIFLCVATSIHYLFPLGAESKAALPNTGLELERQMTGPLSKAEWLGLFVLVSTLIGWLTTPFHGINEAWVALAGLLMFLCTGCLDRKTFRNNVDWGLILFFGIVNSMAVIADHLKVERWITSLVAPILADFSSEPLSFLIIVLLIVSFARVFLRKAAAVVILTVALVPISHNVGIHPGVLLLTILAASECFFLPYQDGPYQIAYSSADGKAFSHRQAQKVLVARFFATALAVAVSVPYWKLLGLIQ